MKLSTISGTPLEPKATFGNCFCFLFSFSCFQGKKKKTIFSCFQNEKHVWLVERKNKFSKNKIQEICLVVVFEKSRILFSLVNFFLKLLTNVNYYKCMVDGYSNRIQDFYKECFMIMS